MNPEGFPLQGSGYGGYPAQPGETRVIQNTTVNIVTDPPKDHIIWSLCCFVYCNPFCLGLAALIYSIKSRDRRMVGDLEGARHYGSTARSLNIVSSVLAVVTFVIFIITIISITVTINQHMSSSYGNTYRNGYYGY